MQVAVVTEQVLAAVPGGVGRYTVELTRALAATAGPSDTVTGWSAWHRDVAGARRSPAPAVRTDCPRRPRCWPACGPAAWGPDRGAPTWCTPPARCSRPGRLPLVVTVHDAVPWTHPETLTPHGARWHRAMISRAVAGRGDDQ